MSFDFEKMNGFHKLTSLWRIEYIATCTQPILTRGVSDELREEIGDKIGKTLPKPDLDAVPLVMDDRAVITGNAVKGIFRHILSAQLTEAGHDICIQSVKIREEMRKNLKENLKKLGRKEECKPEDPCFVCMWFGTPSRQGALHFSFLMSEKNLDEILISEPIPMVALSEDMNALIAVKGKGRFALLAPVKEGTTFYGWIKGENLSAEIIGAIKEIEDMSKKGFVQFGGFKTRGFGSMKIEITKIQKYTTVPFKLEKEYVENDLENLLSDCQARYHRFLLSRGRSA
ncbi:MAG: RAMP superfamily CRISPR-associated protein [Candidatus Bathyarchaeia archaeon]